MVAEEEIKETASEQAARMLTEDLKRTGVKNNDGSISLVGVKDEVKIAKPKEDIKSKAKRIFSVKGQVEEFWKVQPFFFDKSKNFFVWEDENKKYILSDEINCLNLIDESLGLETVQSKMRTELIAALQQVGRKHIPKPIKKTWIQFKDKIYDIKTNEEIDATPEYFNTNPIPHKVGKDKETPKIDKLFEEWVGKENKQQLYEVTSYTTSSNQFMQRIVALCGGGSNGKGSYIKFLTKFIGIENMVSSEIKQLSENQFEPAVLYRKLLCVMGEVSYDDLKNTNIIKKIAGEDLMSFQFKGKTPFTDENITTCFCLTNSLPSTPDKSLGFYRKWLIIDFPNQFEGIKTNLIEDIPEEEFENLAFKTLNLLKHLYKERKFDGEGNFEERIKKYEARSNPVLSFIEECCEEDESKIVTLRYFANECNKYLKLNHLRVLTINQLGKILRNEGFIVGKRKINDISVVCVLNIKLLKLPELPELPKSSVDCYREASEKNGSLGSSNPLKEIPQEIEVQKTYSKLRAEGKTNEEARKLIKEVEEK